jgi:hypothetical protein
MKRRCDLMSDYKVIATNTLYDSEGNAVQNEVRTYLEEMPKNTDIEVNRFIVCEASSLETGDYKYGVYHPVYDGAYCVFGSNDLIEAVKWAESQDFNEWTDKLL